MLIFILNFLNIFSFCLGLKFYGLIQLFPFLIPMPFLYQILHYQHTKFSKLRMLISNYPKLSLIIILFQDN